MKKLNKFYFNEVLDRTSVIKDVFHKEVVINEVILQNKSLNELANEIEWLMSNLYKEIGRIKFKENK